MATSFSQVLLPGRERWMNAFSKTMRELAPLSDTYLAMDTKTTGMENDDAIVQVCLLPVFDGQPDTPFVKTLSYARYPQYYSRDFLKDRLANVQGVHSVTLEEMETHGQDAREALMDCGRFLTALSEGVPLVGHSIFQFGIPRLHRHLVKFFGKGAFTLGPLEFWDVGIMHKAGTAGMAIEPEESIGYYHRRVYEDRLHYAQWSRTHLIEHYGITVPVAAMDPSFAVWVAHQVYDIQRQVVNEAP